jgi:hypothetical protein
VNIILSFEKGIDLSYFLVKLNGYSTKLEGTTFKFTNCTIYPLNNTLKIEVIDISKKFYDISTMATTYVPFSNNTILVPLTIISTNISIKLNTALPLSNFTVTLDTYLLSV